MTLLDRYILRLTLAPLGGALGVTLVALLLERVLRLLDLLSESSGRLGFVAQLAANLVPHYLGLTLPAGFFIALFIVVTRLNEGSEIDALLASGVSLTRIVAPYLALAGVLTVASLILFGVLQPYSRYAYRAVMHAAETAGWSGQAEPQTFFAPDQHLTMTADMVDATGEHLGRVFIRRTLADGREEVTTAASGRLARSAGGSTVRLDLTDGQQFSTAGNGAARVLSFRSFAIDLPLTSAEKLLRGRGRDARELTLGELAAQARKPGAMIPRQELLAELYARLARSFALPLLPLLALPLGLSAKRGGRAPGIILAGLLLVAFQHMLQLGQSLASSGRAQALPAILVPFGAFAAICLVTFYTSRKRPGETPVGVLAERVGDMIRRTFRVRRDAEAEAAA
ncbi:MAG TPA: LptF/LptG family permease [Phenylobacterium sp.]|uniref:LptF/LptG family permease n=1 Tax=Phenylobacterium sp. TaxID=1871053 RepID=UPI002B46BDB6|nr:LptF/LptG family permease [Phenylobacterium sp.]HKR89684.1 LptF/LptG family permease [Phenylobacterium sp.]